MHKPLIALLMLQLLALPAAAQEQSDTSTRVTRPWMASVHVSNLNPAVADIQFNYSPYFAVHGGGGLGFSQSNAVTFPESGPLLQGGVKLYFNPQDIAGFADFTFNSATFLNATVGLEYRHHLGLTWMVATGLGYNFRTLNPGFIYPANSTSLLPRWLITQAGVGYAF